MSDCGECCTAHVFGIVLSLGLFNIPTTSILAGGAVLGFAISFLVAYENDPQQVLKVLRQVSEQVVLRTRMARSHPGTSPGVRH